MKDHLKFFQRNVYTACTVNRTKPFESSKIGSFFQKGCKWYSVVANTSSETKNNLEELSNEGMYEPMPQAAPEGIFF